jgi:hypothetical protein
MSRRSPIGPSTSTADAASPGVRTRVWRRGTAPAGVAREVPPARRQAGAAARSGRRGPRGAGRRAASPLGAPRRPGCRRSSTRRGWARCPEWCAPANSCHGRRGVPGLPGQRWRALAGGREARSKGDGGEGWLVSAVVARVVCPASTRVRRGMLRGGQRYRSAAMASPPRKTGAAIVRGCRGAPLSHCIESAAGGMHRCSPRVATDTRARRRAPGRCCLGRPP